jgi:glycosyltransferase involved in cell wall biosynthesis
MDEQVKRVAVLLPSMMVGGAERLVSEELSCLRDFRQFAVELHLVFDKGPFFDGVASLGLPVHVWNAPHKSIRMLGTYARIIRHLRRTRCDLLHSHLLDGIGPMIGKLAGAGVVATVHSDTQYSTVEKFVLAQSDLVLGCGSQVVHNIQRFIPVSKVAILNNAIRQPDCERVNRGEVLKRFGVKNESRLVVSFGRLTRQKGYDLLIESFKQVVAEIPDAVLLIGGEGEEKGRLAEAVKLAGLGEHIRLPGLVHEVHEVLASCEVYVSSSRCEGLPMTLLEAMAHGKPMVATNVGGNSEVVHDGVTGILVAPEDSDSLAKAIIRMLKDDEFRKKAGVAASALFNREYTIDRHCAALAGYYNQVLQARQPASHAAASSSPEK